MQSRFFSFDTNAIIIVKEEDPCGISPLSKANAAMTQLSVGDPTSDGWTVRLDTLKEQIISLETKFDELMKKPPSPVSVSPLPTLPRQYIGPVNETLATAKDIKQFKTILIEKINQQLARIAKAHKELIATNLKIINREKGLSFETHQNSVSTLTLESMHLAQRVKMIFEKAHENFSAAEVYESFNGPIEDVCKTLQKVVKDLNKHHANWVGYRREPLPRIHV